MHARVLYDDGSAEDLYRLSPGVVEFGGMEPFSDTNGTRRVNIKGSRIVGLQFTLSQEGEQWSITHLGMAPTWLNGRALVSGDRCVIGPNDVIRVPGIRIDLVADQTAERGEHQVSRSPAEARNWQDFQEAIHAALRDEFELDQQNKRASVTNDETRHGIETRLRALVEASMTSVDEGIVLDLVRIALRRVLMWNVASGRGAEAIEAGSAGENGYDSDRTITRRIEQVATDMVRETGLKPVDADGPVRDQDVFEKLDVLEKNFSTAFDRISYRLTFAERRKIAGRVVYQNIHDLIFALGPLSDLMQLDVVTEIMVARYDSIYIEKGGRLEPYPYTFATESQLVTVIQRMLAATGRSFNRTSAMVDFRHTDGSRVNAIGDPLSILGAALTIRKFPRRERPDLQQLAAWNAMSPRMARFLETLVLARKNILISGGTGSGKTTLLNALGRCIPKSDRVVTIEDTAELNLGKIHVVSLQSRPATVESQNAVSIRDLVKNALRMRPDRIVVGECRGGEALDMLQAMNTGHAGSMTTAHANSSGDMILRLETMVLQAESLPVSAIRQQVVAAIDVLVQLNRLGSGQRVVTEISEIAGIHPETGEIVIEPIFTHRLPRGSSELGRFHFTGHLPNFIEDVLRVLPDRMSDLDLFG